MRKGATGMPKCGDGANELGVRAGVDITPDRDGFVAPGTGGLSVTPDDPSLLPPHVRPAHLGGRGMLPVFGIETGKLTGALSYRPDPRHPRTHGFLEPAQVEQINVYQTNLQTTAPDWREDVA
jgi:hypothetical protein